MSSKLFLNYFISSVMRFRLNTARNFYLLTFLQVQSVRSQLVNLLGNRKASIIRYVLMWVDLCNNKY